MKDAHWAGVYAKKPPDSVSWYQADPVLSLALVERAAPPPARVLDVGAGASLLVDGLLARGYRPGVLDLAAEPLAIVRGRLGARAAEVEWFVGDVTKFAATASWDVWHDRAVFHFLTEERDRDAYRAALLRATSPSAQVIIATFGPEGPERCSGLPTVRYSPESLLETLGNGFALIDTEWEEHRTPAGGVQQFVYCRFRRS